MCDRANCFLCEGWAHGGGCEVCENWGARLFFGSAPEPFLPVLGSRPAVASNATSTSLDLAARFAVATAEQDAREGRVYRGPIVIVGEHATSNESPTGHRGAPLKHYPLGPPAQDLSRTHPSTWIGGGSSEGGGGTRTRRSRKARKAASVTQATFSFR